MQCRRKYSKGGKKDNKLRSIALTHNLVTKMLGVKHFPIESIINKNIEGKAVPITGREGP
jgi:hypothetical protein